MSVRFRLKGMSYPEGAEMTNGTARIVLRMLGLPWEGYLEGRLLIAEAKERLGRIDAAVIAEHVEPPRVLGPGWFDRGASEDDLRAEVEALRRLVELAEQRRKIQIVWD